MKAVQLTRNPHVPCVLKWSRLPTWMLACCPRVPPLLAAAAPQVRQLRELGLTVPRDVAEAAAEGEKFYRYGVMLKKVANFWNSLGEQIVASQRPMLLNALKAFEKMVRARTSEGGVAITWRTPGECEQYVDRLQSAAEKLAAENGALRRSHAQLVGQVRGLMAVDLLRQKESWKAKWAECSAVMDGLRRRYPEEHMRKWALHWDKQMYKALEAAYQLGLESLNENLSEIKAELVVAHAAPAFKPGIEELRSVYYREMKKFVSLPANFPGFGNKQVYARMGDANRESLAAVYRKAEELFARLAGLLEGHRPWCALAAVDDLDALVEAQVDARPPTPAPALSNHGGKNDDPRLLKKKWHPMRPF